MLDLFDGGVLHVDLLRTKHWPWANKVEWAKPKPLKDLVGNTVAKDKIGFMLAVCGNMS